MLVSIKKAQEENSRNVISRAMQICREKQVGNPIIINCLLVYIFGYFLFTFFFFFFTLVIHIYFTSPRLVVQVDAKTAIVDGDAKEVICQAAEQMQADLLVVGSRGLGTIKRL